jgi:hypothetical protein
MPLGLIKNTLALGIVDPSTPSILDALGPVTREMTLAIPALLPVGVKYSDSPVRMLNVPKLWNRLRPTCVPALAGIVMCPENLPVGPSDPSSVTPPCAEEYSRHNATIANPKVSALSMVRAIAFPRAAI